jgi:hypothetical protein
MNYATTLRALSLLCLAAFLALVPAQSPAANLNGNCTLNTAAFKQIDAHLSFTGGTTQQAIPGATISFTQGGSRADCVVIQFTAHTHGSGANGADLLYDLDNGAAGEQQIYIRAVPAGPMAPHTAVFILPSVAPGAHFVRMRVASTTSDALSMEQIRMLVHYRK